MRCDGCGLNGIAESHYDHVAILSLHKPAPSVSGKIVYAISRDLACVSTDLFAEVSDGHL